MLRNYVKMTFRYLLKNRVFSAINIFGLTLGFASFLVIALYLYDELNFDMFHRDAARIHRIIQHEQLEDGTARDVIPVASRLGPEVAKQLPEVEESLRILVAGRLTMGNDPTHRFYERIAIVDTNFFSFFSFPLLKGDPETALRDANAIVISESMSKKYFGNESPLGKEIWSAVTYNDKPVYFTVTGVMKDFPKDSHMKFEILFTEATWAYLFDWYAEFNNTDWESNTFVTYVKVKAPQENLAAMEEKMTALVKSNYPQEKEFKSSFSLQPLSAIHMHSDQLQGNDLNTTGFKPFYVYMFSGVATMLLLIASLNYMNLSTAAAFKRTREIGTRKTLGAGKGQLITQFAGEAVALSLLSMALALAVVQISLPSINTFTDKELVLEHLPVSWIFILLGSMLLTGVLASMYPAFIISRVAPSEALKRDVRIGKTSLPVRKILVAGQFAISIIMITSTLVIYRQLNFLRNKDLGFNPNGKLVVDINSPILRNEFETVKTRFRAVPEVEQISTSTRVPGEWKNFPITTVHAGAHNKAETIWVGIDEDFLSTYDIKLLDGRNFTQGSADSSKVILTRLAVEQLGLVDPVGKVIEIPTVRWAGSIRKLDQAFRAEVIGVVEDFHFESFRSKMMPLIFGAKNTPIQVIDYFTLKISTSNWEETLNKLKEVNNKIDPDNPLEYTFLDNRFEQFYASDEKRGQIFIVFSLIIVLIACLGLFALVSYSIETRTKEIGIRKVLGASVESIVGIISKEFLLLVVAGALIAVPASWYFMKSWLQEFAYSSGVAIDVYIAGIGIALLIAFITICARTLRAAMVNPVKSLRSE